MEVWAQPLNKDKDKDKYKYKHKYKYKQKHRYGHNHCRNPNKADRGPWCYVPGTKDSYYIGLQGWDYCAIPYCEGELEYRI